MNTIQSPRRIYIVTSGCPLKFSLIPYSFDHKVANRYLGTTMHPALTHSSSKAINLPWGCITLLVAGINNNITNYIQSYKCFRFIFDPEKEIKVLIVT